MLHCASDDLTVEAPRFQALVDYLSSELRPMPYREAAKQIGTDLSNSTYRKFGMAYFRSGVAPEYKDVRSFGGNADEGGGRGSKGTRKGSGAVTGCQQDTTRAWALVAVLSP